MYLSDSRIKHSARTATQAILCQRRDKKKDEGQATLERRGTHRVDEEHQAWERIYGG
jgi:hypothetical protein